jgi:intracellular sulfur oxidation DsrE/DsrF family protein
MLKRLSALLLCASFPVGLLAQAAPVAAHHVVFVITSGTPEDWQRTMTLADHFIAGVKPETTDVEVLAYGPGIGILAKGAATASQMPDLEKQGVKFVACQNAMRSAKLTQADLLPGVTSVPSGVVELVRKQEAGFSYIKVGE